MLKKILVVTLTTTLLLVGWWFIHRGQASRSAPGAAAGGKGGRGGGPSGPVPVVAGKVAKKDVPIYLDGLGTVQAFNTVTVHVRVDGQLEKVAFTEGQDVHAGDLLAEIDPRPYQAMLDQAIAKKAQDEAQSANAHIMLDRDTDLLKKNVIAKQDFDTQKASADQFVATVQGDQAAIDNARTQLGYTKVTSPIDGRVGIRQVDAGNIVHAADQGGLVVVTQLRPISAIFTLPEQELLSIQQQMAQHKLVVSAVDRNNASQLSTGELAVVDNQIDPTTATIKLKATFPNEDLSLWPGQFVNARLLLTTRKDAAVVPDSVVQRGPQGTYAYVIKPDSTVEMRPIKVGQTEGGQALIEEGLTPGEEVVVDGQYKLQPGAKVQPTEDHPHGARPKKLGQQGNGGSGMRHDAAFAWARHIAPPSGRGLLAARRTDWTEGPRPVMKPLPGGAAAMSSATATPRAADPA